MSEGAGRRRVLRATLALVGTGVLLWLAFRQVEPATLAVVLRSADPRWLVLAAALVPVQIALAALRWSTVCAALGLPLGRAEAVREYALSSALNQVLPGGIAGDAVRVWRHRRRGADLGGAVRGAVAERWIGQAVLAVATLAGLALWTPLLPAHPAPPRLVPVLALVSALVLAVGILPARVPVLGPVARDARSALRAAPLRLLGLSALLHLSLLLGFQACGMALGRPFGAALWVAVPVMLTAMAVPFAVGGWGPRELGAVAVLTLVGWTPTEAFAVAALFGLATLVGAAPGLLVPLAGLRGDARAA